MPHLFHLITFNIYGPACCYNECNLHYLCMSICRLCSSEGWKSAAILGLHDDINWILSQYTAQSIFCKSNKISLNRFLMRMINEEEIFAWLHFSSKGHLIIM